MIVELLTDDGAQLDTSRATDAERMEALRLVLADARDLVRCGELASDRLILYLAVMHCILEEGPPTAPSSRHEPPAWQRCAACSLLVPETSHCILEEGR